MILEAGDFLIYECDACGELTKVGKTEPPPDGYYLTIRRVRSGRRNRQDYREETLGTPYFCDIPCFKTGIQYHSYRDDKIV